jgi:hypothetical protein
MNDAASDALDVVPEAGQSPLDLRGGLHLRLAERIPHPDVALA